MISFRDLNTHEFLEYKNCFIDEYSQELSENYMYSKDKSLVIATHDFKTSFEDSDINQNNHLYGIEIDESGIKELVGYIWYSIDEEKHCAFINDFYIFPQNRNQGLGSMSLLHLESILSKSDIWEIKLRVAYTNKSAARLYKKIGFTETGINMNKILR
ncbi:GNAT family N-acetyltransferase [Spirochaeta isovalerica]|uniref:Ribosomal protein S18 acetylase RimI-like enzyme n=1 Tax=Spirochaeta isovalerica TaxID=150 RepID=A0A841RB82_9SPIO|nr:GNAT family N-acetyltransferase [Spirochaeta isovalerica]MBB6480270.1 ribosomal protein S18 acetylase RimI-like enzyme [Spirochaeta isovalerica]